jgi:hypothetical protein
MLDEMWVTLGDYPASESLIPFQVAPEPLQSSLQRAPTDLIEFRYSITSSARSHAAALPSPAMNSLRLIE